MLKHKQNRINKKKSKSNTLSNFKILFLIKLNKSVAKLNTKVSSRRILYSYIFSRNTRKPLIDENSVWVYSNGIINCEYINSSSSPFDE